MAHRSIPIARRLRADQTSAEGALWTQLRGRRLEGCKFRRQVPIGGFFADFACLDLGLTIELDGSHHALQMEADLARRALIEARGFVELRFTNVEIAERMDWVVQEIRRAIDTARGLPMRDARPRLDL
ncbi:MAG: endonuclease protein [Hyphomicrobiales bacterium]|nr:endonuclease protein [Hyphomicrobiales bacterium]